MDTEADADTDADADAYADAGADEVGEAIEGSDMVEEEKLIGRGGHDMVDATGGSSEGGGQPW